MKKVLCGLVVVILGLFFMFCVSYFVVDVLSDNAIKSTRPDAAADPPDHYAIDREMTLDFSFGEKSGVYTGLLNDDGLPDGVGSFSSVNSAGVSWVFTGEWDAGHWDGAGYTVFADGEVRMGLYQNDLSGKYGLLYLPNGVFFGGFDADENASGIFIDENDVTFYAQIIDGTLYTQPADDVLASEPAATPAATPTPRPSPSNPPTPAPDPVAALDDALRDHIEAEYSLTTIDRITINEDYGTDLGGDYIALVYLTWTQRNGGDLSKTMLTMYSDDLAVWTADNCPDVQELAVFWTVPYLDADAKRSYERRDGGMYLTDSVFGAAFG